MSVPVVTITLSVVHVYAQLQAWPTAQPDGVGKQNLLSLSSNVCMALTNAAEEHACMGSITPHLM